MEYKKPESEFTMFDWWKKVVFENYANFDGRARRSEYWYFTLVNILITIGLFLITIVPMAILGEDEILGSIAILPALLLLLFSVALIIPSIAVSVRRLHDTGKSGWLVVLGMIPIISYIGSIVLLVFYCIESDHGPNQYGPNPKEVGNDIY